MDHEIAEVLEPKLAFGYDYDFGGTTQLKLKVAGMRTGKWKGKDKVRLVIASCLPSTDRAAPGILWRLRPRNAFRRPRGN